MRYLFNSICIFLLAMVSIASAKETSSKPVVFFSSDARLDHQFIQLIDEEEKSIHFAVFHFSHYPIAEALIRAKRRGVEVTLIVDKLSVKKRSPLQKLLKENIPVFVWRPESVKRKGRDLMNHKFCVFGGQKVWSGSCNFTRSLGGLHRENALLLQEENIAESYIKEFKNLLFSCEELQKVLEDSSLKK